MTASVDYTSHLPPYRSLLNPTARYDYQLHSLIPIPQAELVSIIKAYSHQNKKSDNLKMKYKSLLSDVSRKTSLISRKISNQNFKFMQPTSAYPTTTSPASSAPVTLRNLPIEIQYQIFGELDVKDLKSCLHVCKHWYKVSKKILYSDLSFDSSFRFAQFITLLRINPKLGNLVKSVDLSDLKPCNYEIELYEKSSSSDELEILDESNFKAGWRDWKFIKNPLYSINSPLTRVHSNSHSASSVESASKRKKLKISLLKRKRKRNIDSTFQTTTSNEKSTPGFKNHPSINKFLLSYSNTKDIPAGYLLHLIKLCPNIEAINLQNVSLSIDYEINSNFIYKFHTFDIIHNYPKQMLPSINQVDDSGSLYHAEPVGDDMSLRSLSSSCGSTAPAKPVWKYNSLLTPPPNLNYLAQNDGKVYLSDLNLKSINNQYLKKINESDVLFAISKIHSNNTKFNYINLSSTIWLNKSLVKKFLNRFLKTYLKINYLNSISSGDYISKDLVIDLTNSGMYRNALWAKHIDLNNVAGYELLVKVLNDDLHDDFEAFLINERIRRGRMGENYLS